MSFDYRAKMIEYLMTTEAEKFPRLNKEELLIAEIEYSNMSPEELFSEFRLKAFNSGRSSMYVHC